MTTCKSLLTLLLAVGMVACSGKKEDAPAAEAKPANKPAAAPAPAAAKPAEKPVADEVPVEADFEAEAETQITEKNYRAELEALEKAVAAE